PLEDLPRRVRGRAVRSYRQGAHRHLALPRAEAAGGNEFLRRRCRGRPSGGAGGRALRDRQPHEGCCRKRSPGDERRLRVRGGCRSRLRGLAPVTLRAVVKAGGSAGVDRDSVADLVADIARSDEIVLVHGASGETNKLAAALGHPQETVVSPSGPETLPPGAPTPAI